MSSIQPTSRGAQFAKGVEIAYYITAVAALAVGVLGAHGLLGHQLHGFMNHTLPNALPTRYLFVVGAGAALAPKILKQAVKDLKAERERQVIAY